MIEQPPPSLKTVLAQWVNDRQQALLEQVMLTWHEGMGRMSPDDALVDRLLAAVPVPEPPPAPEPADTDGDLGAGLDLLDGAGTQGEVLKRLLDALRPFAQRGALFVVKQGIANLYAHRGFDGEPPRAGAPVVPPAELEDLIQGRIPRIAAPGPAYQALLGPLNHEAVASLLILPLRLRRKTVAILLADSAGEPIRHPAHLRSLALAAEARLTHLAVAKEEERAAPPEPQPSTLTQRIPEAIAEALAPALDPKVRVNAERSARVLVGDLELYFPDKLLKGQQQGDLYAAMKDELDRSRHSFVERYGPEVESQHHIFYQTVVQQLCGGDRSRLGQPAWAFH